MMCALLHHKREIIHLKILDNSIVCGTISIKHRTSFVDRKTSGEKRFKWMANPHRPYAKSDYFVCDLKCVYFSCFGQESVVRESQTISQSTAPLTWKAAYEIAQPWLSTKRREVRGNTEQIMANTPVLAYRLLQQIRVRTGQYYKDHIPERSPMHCRQCRFAPLQSLQTDP